MHNTYICMQVFYMHTICIYMCMCMTELEIVQISILPKCLVKSVLVKFSTAIKFTVFQEKIS